MTSLKRPTADGEPDRRRRHEPSHAQDQRVPSEAHQNAPSNGVIRRPDPATEFLTPERCWILETWNDPGDPAVSIARARVAPGITTQLHRLCGTDERYLILSGSGVVRIGSRSPERVAAGNVVVIPAGAAQQITNDGDSDLVFYCICTPRFLPECYEAME